MIATEILIESKTARDGQLTQVSHEAASDVLGKAKALVFALWQGTGAATTQEMADYYEVPEDTVQKVHQRNRAELMSDGVKTIKGKELREVRDILSTSQERLPSLTIWTPRAALRLGMLLRDSEVAKQVRTVLLDVADGDRISEPNPQPLPTTHLELTVTLGQEMVKLEKKVTVLVETAAEHDRAISELKEKATTSSGSEPTAAPLTAKEQLRLEIEKVRLKTVKERNRGRELQVEAKKQGKFVPASKGKPDFRTRILTLLERKKSMTVRDMCQSFTAKHRFSATELREKLAELVASGEIATDGKNYFLPSPAKLTLCPSPHRAQ